MSLEGDLFVQAGIIIPEYELSIRACRASGSGGQHVNKTSTKIQLTWSPHTSIAFTTEEKDRIIDKLHHRINKAGYITCSVEETRSQHKNIELAKMRLVELIKRGLYVQKARKPTKPTRGSKERRLKAKKQRSNLKAQRGQKKWD